MTIDDLLTQLKDISTKLEPAADDESKFELDLLILEMDKQTIAAAFDPLTELSAVAPVEVEKLRALVLQVDQAIVSEQKRVKFVETIISLAKIALKAAGVGLPGLG
jgi:hypothetical protein